MTQNNQALLKVMGATLAFSLTGVFVVAGNTNPIVFATIRSLVAAIILGVGLMKTARWRVSGRGLLVGLIGGISNYFWVGAFMYADAASVAALGYSFPIFIPVLKLIWGKRARGWEWLLTGIIAVALLIIFLTGATVGGKNVLFGDILALGGALTWGIFFLGVEALSPEERAAVPVCSQVLAVIIGLVLVSLSGFELVTQTAAHSVLFAVLNGISVAVAVALIASGMSIGATAVAIISSAEIALTPLLMGLILNRWPMLGSSIGAGIVLVVGVVGIILAAREKRE